MKKLLSIILSLSLLFSTTKINASDPTLLKEGQAAPYEGFLFSREKEQANRYHLISLTEINESLRRTVSIHEEISKLKDDKIKLYEEQNTRLAEALRSERGMNNLERIGWFALGVIGATLSAYAISKIK